MPLRGRGEPRPYGKLYSGRFAEGLLPELEHFASSLDVDIELAPFDILGSLAHELRRRGGGYGVAALCIGVGQGLAVVLEG